MSAQCLRCGIDVSEYGRVCKDCEAVAPRFSAELRTAAEAKIRAKRAKDGLLRGMTYVGTTAEQGRRRRDEGRKR